MPVSCRILKARNSSRPARHWVEMSATKSDTDVMEIERAWNQRGMLYFTSTCGTEMHEETCLSNFEDYFGTVACKEINRLSICNFVCEVLRIVDEHNRGRQSVLGLEIKLLTKDFWFRSLAIMIRLRAVNAHK